MHRLRGDSTWQSWRCSAASWPGADNDRHISAILAARFAVPGLGDIARIDWASVPAVDVITAGFPCQDISFAGRGAGLEKGSRSSAWNHVMEAVRQLRPGLVVLENVAALAWPAPFRGERGRSGRYRLGVDFTEWCQGLPMGWAAGIPGLTYAAKIRALGNGVVPRQGAAALRLLIRLAAIPAPPAAGSGLLAAA